MRFSTAIGVSVALHGVLAAALAAYIRYASGPATLATLDLSSVDLSFAEEEDETAAVAPSPPAPPPVAPPAPPEEKPPEPAAERLDDRLPPDPAAPRLPEPEPDRRPMVTPEIPPEAERPQERPEPPPAAPAPFVAPKQAKIDAPPRPRRAIRPDYPKGSRQRGEQGDVVVELRITAEGTVDRVEIVSSCGYPELDEAAVRAAKAARFTPAKSGQTAVASTARLTLTFRLK